MVEPNGGTNLNGTYVQLYQDGDVKQRFYELSCQREIQDRPCRFMDRKIHNMSRCVQKYSYSYALVREQSTGSPFNQGGSGSGSGDPSSMISNNPRHHHHREQHAFSLPPPSSGGNGGPSGSGWMLDYIRVRSGCSCEVTPKTKKKRNHKLQKNKNKKNHYDFE